MQMTLQGLQSHSVSYITHLHDVQHVELCRRLYCARLLYWPYATDGKWQMNVTVILYFHISYTF
jgi:hypothetical protein